MNFRSILLAGAAATLTISMGSNAFAADAPAAEKDNGAGLETLVVTARKVSEKVQSVPVSISAFSTRRLTDLQLKNVGDISYQTPGFSVVSAASDAHTPALAIRGQYQNDTLLTTDGPVSAYLDGIYLPRTQGLTAAMVDIERVEVLKGPQGTLYGKNTTGGAISIVSHKPELDKFGAYADISYGNYQAWTFEGMGNVPLVADKLGLRVVARYNEHKGYGHDANGAELNADKDHYIRGELLWKSGNGLSVLIEGDYTDLKSSGVGDHLIQTGKITDILGGNGKTPGAYLALIGSYGLQKGLISGAQLGAVLTPPSSPFFNPAAFGAALPAFFGAEANLKAQIGPPAGGSFYDSRQGGPAYANYTGQGVSGTVAYEFNGLVARSITGYRKYLRDNRIDLDGTSATILDARLTQNPHVFSEEVQIAKSTHQGLDFIVGAFYSKEHGNEFSQATNLPFVNPANPAFTDGTVDNTSKAIYGQATYNVTHQIRITGGLRYSKDDRQLVSRNRAKSLSLDTTVTSCSVTAVIATPGICESTPFKNDYSAVDYLASVDYKPTEDMLFYAKTTRGFKAGGQNLRGQDAASFASFAPEYVTEYEIGAKVDLLERRLRVNVAGFYDKDKGLQRSVVLVGPSGGLLTIVTNAGRAHVTGVETEVTAVPVRGLTLSGTVGYIDAKYDSFTDLSGPGGTLKDRSKEPFGVPKWTYSLAGTYAFPVGANEVRATLDWAFRGTSALSPSVGADNASFVSQQGYGLLGGRLAFKLKNYGTEFSVFGRNLTGKEYYAGGLALDSSLGIIIKQPGTPRTFGVAIHQTF